MSSMRFAISMLSIVGIASIIGTVLKQNQSYESYIIKFGQFWFEFFEILNLYNVYQASWFLLILLFLVSSTSLCVYRNSPRIVREFKLFQDNVKEKKIHHFKIDKSLENELKEKEIKERNEKSDLNLQNMPTKNDLVVHLTHGIGIFNGLKHIDTFIGTTDCLEIEYANNSKVYVPIEHMNLVSKYFGPKERSIDVLGSKRWVARKDKALKKTFDTAAELL